MLQTMLAVLEVRPLQMATPLVCIHKALYPMDMGHVSSYDIFHDTPYVYAFVKEI